MLYRILFFNTCKSLFVLFYCLILIVLFLFCREENSKLKAEIQKIQQSKASNGSVVQRQNSDYEHCAILGVHLPAPTEYEYLRNVMLEFMMGKEPVVSAFGTTLGTILGTNPFFFSL